MIALLDSERISTIPLAVLPQYQSMADLTGRRRHGQTDCVALCITEWMRKGDKNTEIS